jgi:acyl-CoA synthetase (AMP-forming)/AMP-acid ligase II
LIITGGFNVYPKEVEQVLIRHEDVAEAAVFGRPHVDLGEQVCAAVVLNERASIQPEDLIHHCKKHLTPYKCPRMVFVLNELPRNAMGKVQKEALKEILEGGLEYVVSGKIP